MRNDDLARKNYLRWLVLARLEGLGLSLREMARQSGMTLRQVRTALKSPAYQEFRDARLQMRVSAMDRLFAEDNEQMAARLRELVPAAMNVLERGLADPNLNVAVRAAVEVLDRDQRFNRTIAINVHPLIPKAEIDRARELARELRAEQLRAEQLRAEQDVLEIEPKALPKPN
jgi:hypothetical protein